MRRELASKGWRSNRPFERLGSAARPRPLNASVMSVFPETSGRSRCEPRTRMELAHES